MRVLLLLALAACGSRSEAAATKDDGKPRTPEATLGTLAAADVCITKGSPDATIGSVIGDPSFRAVAPHTTGEAASLTFTYSGATDEASALASGKVRRQLGLKLRAENGCNLVYVMWRLDPKPKLEVSVKLNPGAKDHGDCGADGYTKVKPTRSTTVPHLSPRTQHTLQAELRGSELIAWIDGKLAWRGVLPAKAAQLRGPAGVRSDNLVYSLDAFEAQATTAPVTAEAKCVGATDS